MHGGYKANITGPHLVREPRAHFVAHGLWSAYLHWKSTLEAQHIKRPRSQPPSSLIRKRQAQKSNLFRSIQVCYVPQIWSTMHIPDSPQKKKWVKVDLSARFQVVDILIVLWRLVVDIHGRFPTTTLEVLICMAAIFTSFSTSSCPRVCGLGWASRGHSLVKYVNSLGHIDFHWFSRCVGPRHTQESWLYHIHQWQAGDIVSFNYPAQLGGS